MKASSPSANVSSFLPCSEGSLVLRPLWSEISKAGNRDDVWYRRWSYLPMRFVNWSMDSFIGNYSSIYILLPPLLEFLPYYYTIAFRRWGPQRSNIKSSERKMVCEIGVEAIFPWVSCWGMRFCVGGQWDPHYSFMQTSSHKKYQTSTMYSMGTTKLYIFVLASP